MKKMLENKIKKIKSAKYAFTLVELLGVIIILGVLALITYPIIDGSIKNSKQEAFQNMKENIEDAAYNYSVENDIGYPSEKTALYLSEIQSKGYLDKNIINPITNEKLQGCVWYYWDEEFDQYIFEYDSECIEPEFPPKVTITYNKELINNNGWAKVDVPVTIAGTGDLKYCIDSTECEPTELIENVNTKYITNEGTNYICAIASNDSGTIEKKCEQIKLDKNNPSFNIGVDTSTWNQLGISVNSSSDLVSGIDHYEYYIKLKSADDSAYELIYSGTNISYITNDVSGNTYNIKVIAYDKAGNSTTKITEAKVIMCFAAGTEVFTENGYKPIEDIKVGDKVWTINLETNDMILKTVSKTFVNDSYEIMHIKIDNEVIEATPRHQFYVVDKGWVRAYDLEVGDKFISDNGTVEINNVEYEKLKKPIKVYNFTVDEEHTYLVTKYSILVHNAGSAL